MVPIGIYGDSARIETTFGVDWILAFFANVCLWRPKSVRWSRFLILAIEESRLTSETIPAILRRITWSANHAFFGFFPKEGHLGQNLSPSDSDWKRAGQPLTSKGLRFQVTELRGDWSFRKKIWRFLNCQWNSIEMCHVCSAKGISDSWQELYWNCENNNHVEFSFAQFLARRIPPRRV